MLIIATYKPVPFALNYEIFTSE